MQTLVQEADARQIVTLHEAKEHLRITLDTEDDRTMQEVDAAISLAEDFCRRPIRKGQWQLSRSDWQVIDNRQAIRLQGTVASVDSIKYAVTGSSPLLQTISSTVYDVLIGQHSTLIREAPNQAWPELGEYLENIRVTFTSGWDGNNVPYQIRQGCLLALQYIHDNDTVAWEAAQALLKPSQLPPW